MTVFKRVETLAASTFLLLSAVWIIYSDSFFLNFYKNISTAEITRIQTIKGCFYIIVVTIVIYFLVKHLNKKLLQSENVNKDLFYNSINPLIVFDKLTHRIKNVNKSAINAYGYTFEEFKQLTIDNIRRNFSTEFKTGSFSQISCHNKKNNQEILCKEIITDIYFENEPALLLSIKEITEIEKIKNELKKKEDELRLIKNSITDGFFVLNNNMQVMFANEYFKELVQTPAKSFEGRHLLDLFPDSKDLPFYNQYVKAIQTKKPAHFELFDQKSSWYSVSAYPFENGLTVFFKDITVEKQQELKINEDNQNLLALINNTEDLIWSIDKNFRYYTYNEPYARAYAELFGEELWMGKSALNASQGQQHIEKWQKLYQKALDGKKFSVDMDFVIMHACKSATVRFNPIYDQAGNIMGVSCFLQNISERKLYERKIEQQNRQLRKIAFITSHKVRVPLSNILGLVEVLDPADPLSASNCEIIELIKHSAQLLDRTIINIVEQTVSMED